MQTSYNEECSKKETLCNPLHEKPRICDVVVIRRSKLPRALLAGRGLQTDAASTHNAAATTTAAAATTTSRPNVLLLIIDDLRPDLGAYGHRAAHTPNIDALAARSTLFSRAHASVANCAPSRSSLLTGMRPDRHGVMDLVTHLRDTVPNVVTLPQRFREAGYLSVGYGKIFHQNLDDGLSWSSQAEFPDANHSYRGLRGAAWVRAGGWRRGWRYDQYRLPANVKAQRTRDRAQPLYSVVPPYESGPTDDPRGRGTTDAHIASSAIAALRRLRAQPKPWPLRKAPQV